MTPTQQFVYETFVIYIAVKAAILLPLGWFTFLVRRSEKRAQALASAVQQVVAVSSATSAARDLPAHEPVRDLRLPEAA